MTHELGPVGRNLESKLRVALRPITLLVTDESNQHHGHAGAHPSGESHFRVRIAAEMLKGKSRVMQHRMVHEAVAEELKTRVHALAIEVV